MSRSKIQTLFSVVGLIILLFVSGAQAQKKEKKVNISFDNELVQGAADNPSVETVFSKSRMDFKKMIKLRENFTPEADKGKGEFSGNR
ncbi:MAG: hypothetical protein AB7H97_20940 [Pseudobdellovibrionaceae bacterium]